MFRNKLSNTYKHLISTINSLINNPLINKLIYLASICYTLLLLFLSRSEIRFIDWRVFWRLFLISFLLYFVSLSIQCITWSFTLDGNLSNILVNSEVFYHSILLQRIPGGFWHWLGRVNFYREYETENFIVNDKVIRIANLYEWLLFVLSGISIYLWTKNSVAGVISSVMCLMTMVFVYQKIKPENRYNVIVPFLTILFMVVRWGLGSCTLELLLNNLIFPETVSFQIVLATWTLSSTIGVATFFLPSTGIIRDLTLTALLAPTIPIQKVLLLAAELRIIFLISDLLSSGINLVSLKIWRRKITKAS